MLQLLGNGDQIALAQGFQVLPQIGAEILQRFIRQGRVLCVQRADGVQGVEQEVGLDLRHHDLDSLGGHQIPLVFPNKLQMQPDIIKHAAHHDGDGQEGNGKRFHIYMEIDHNGSNDAQPDENRDELFFFSRFPKAQQGIDQQSQQQNAADHKAGRIKRAAQHGKVEISDFKTQLCVRRGKIERGIDPHQQPLWPLAALRQYDIKEQNQDHRSNGVTVGS